MSRINKMWQLHPKHKRIYVKVWKETVLWLDASCPHPLTCINSAHIHQGLAVEAGEGVLIQNCTSHVNWHKRVISPTAFPSWPNVIFTSWQPCIIKVTHMQCEDQVLLCLHGAMFSSARVLLSACNMIWRGGEREGGWRETWGGEG